MRFCAIAFLLLPAHMLAQTEPGILAVTVVDSRGETPPAFVSVRQSGKNHWQYMNKQDATYSLKLPAGRYDVQIESSFFSTETIRGIEVRANQISALSPIELHFDGMCSGVQLPRHYQPLPVSISGRLTGVITNNDQGPVSNTAVILYAPRVGRLGATVTDANGGFSFADIPPRSDYWIRTSRSGYFDEEFPGLTVQAGFETVYEPLSLESCPPGRCDPFLKKVQIEPACY